MSNKAVVLLAILAALVVLAVVDRLRRGRARLGGDGPEGGPPARWAGHGGAPPLTGGRVGTGAPMIGGGMGVAGGALAAPVARASAAAAP